MEFNRDPIDAAVSLQIERAVAQGATPELAFLLDGPLREYVVAIRQMTVEGANFSDVADATISTMCSMTVHLSALLTFREGEEFVQFVNKIMYEMAKGMNKVVDMADTKNAHEIVEMKEIKPDGETKH